MMKEKMMKQKINLLKKPLNPFSVIFWAFVAVVLAVLGLFIKRKKTK